MRFCLYSLCNPSYQAPKGPYYPFRLTFIFYVCGNWGPGRVDESSRFRYTAELGSQPTVQGPVSFLFIVRWRLQAELRTNNAWEWGIWHFSPLIWSSWCHKENIVLWVELCLPKNMFWNLWMWLYLETGSLQMYQVKMKSCQIRMRPKPRRTGALIRRGTFGHSDADTQGRRPLSLRQRRGWCIYQPRSAKNCWSPPETQRGKASILP